MKWKAEKDKILKENKEKQRQEFIKNEKRKEIEKIEKLKESEKVLYKNLHLILQRLRKKLTEKF